MSLKGYWKLNGNANDSAGSQNGTNNGASFGAAYGKLGQGAYFDGTAKYIDTPSQNFSYITISFMAYVINTSGQIHMFVSKDGYSRGGDGIRGYNLMYEQNLQQFRFEFFNTTTSATCNYTMNIIGAWTHIVATFDGTYIKIYVNGVFKAQQALNGTLLSNTSTIRLGTRNTNTTYSLKGYMDEVKIDNSVWSVAAIKNEYARIRGFF